MIRDYYEQISDMHSSQSLDELQKNCGQMLNAIGIKYYKYEWQPSQYLIKSDVQRITACPMDWMCHYQEQNFSSVDPKVRYAQNSIMPIVWSPSFRTSKNVDSAAEQRFWQHSIDFGLGHGATIPIRSRLGGSGMFCVALPADKQERENALNYLPRVEAMAFHLQNAVELLIASKDNVILRLTDRESEVVKWTACGKTACEISMILSVTEPTILFHLKNAKTKLNVINKHQLTARALALGML